MHCELLVHFEEHHTKFDMKAHTIGDRNIIDCIKTCIEQLAAESRLRKLDENLKKKYADCFPSDIPHIHDLPKDVYHHIEVKPGMVISTAHAYSCPKKYCEGWKTFIDQHYAAGCIWPSSQYASPSFIIPKVDISVLP